MLSKEFLQHADGLIYSIISQIVCFLQPPIGRSTDGWKGGESGDGCCFLSRVLNLKELPTELGRREHIVT